VKFQHAYHDDSGKYSTGSKGVKVGGIIRMKTGIKRELCNKFNILPLVANSYSHY
jgi:hypothetical protein